jgi:hypothetical protein
MSEIIEGEYALAVQEQTAPVAWTPSFAVAVDDAIDRKRQKRRFFQEVMEEGLHYGVIPGTGTKPTLLKPGAEMLLGNMGLHEELSDAQPPIQDFDGRDHGGEPFIYYRRVCRIYRQVGPTEHERVKVAQAEGSCSSWEPKYRYRNEQRVCPQCGKAAIIKGKEEYGGGFICFKKKDGCGAKFSDNDPAIIGQAQGKVANPDVVEIDNTILKMADKRALIAATLLATGCSDIFTQDAEDFTPPADAAPEPPKPRAAAPEPPATPGPSVDDYKAAWLAKGSPEGSGKAFMAAHGGTIASAMAALAKYPDAAAVAEAVAFEPYTEAQDRHYFALCQELKFDEHRRAGFNEVIGGKKSHKAWSKEQMTHAIETLSKRLDAQNAQQETLR